MKEGILHARDGRAQQRILAAAAQLAGLIGVANTPLERLRNERGGPLVQAMLQREAIADLLESAVERVSALQAAGQASLTAEDVLDRVAQAGLPKASLGKIREALLGSAE